MRVSEREHGVEVNPDPHPPAPIGHLAIMVVYVLQRGLLPLLKIHLDRIAQHTSVPYTIFATQARLSPPGREILATAPNLRVIDVPLCTLRGSREHAYYLDAMIPEVLASPATHVCTLDVDSFPIDDAWLDVLSGIAPPESGVSGVLRSENGDTALPHPSCILMTREFVERHQPSFSPDSDGTLEFRRFRRVTGQAADTGVRIGSTLWNHALPWGHIERTNMVNPHYLMGGIYGDVVFHLGGIGRAKVFRKDLDALRTHRWSRPLELLPTRGARLASMKERTLRKVRQHAANEVATLNQRIYEDIRDWLFRDAEGLFAYLRALGPLDERYQALAEATHPHAHPHPTDAAGPSGDEVPDRGEGRTSA